jgi:hypothetical protein
VDVRDRGKQRLRRARRGAPDVFEPSPVGHMFYGASVPGQRVVPVEIV